LKTTKEPIKNSPIALGWACPKQLTASILCFFWKKHTYDKLFVFVLKKIMCPTRIKPVTLVITLHASTN
jgi:hypothetical protein